MRLERELDAGHRRAVRCRDRNVHRWCALITAAIWEFATRRAGLLISVSMPHRPAHADEDGVVPDQVLIQLAVAAKYQEPPAIAPSGATRSFSSCFAGNPVSGHILGALGTSRRHRTNRFSPARSPAQASWPATSASTTSIRCSDLSSIAIWGRCVGVADTVDQEAGAATVLKTAQCLFHLVPGRANEQNLRSELPSELSQRNPRCASLARGFAADFAARRVARQTVNAVARTLRPCDARPRQHPTLVHRIAALSPSC